MDRKNARPHVVIVGAGFGGLSAAKALAKAPVDITVIDRHNYHLFQPLLYQVATSALSPADIAVPIRGILARQKNARVLLAEVTGLDLSGREVVTEDRRIPFDYLLLATGAKHAYFGHPEWSTSAPGLKTIDDALDIRRRVLLAFERAEAESDPAERSRLLTFVVVGGGATGVEMAGAIAELAKHSLAGDFRSIDPTMARVVLLEAGPRLLPAFTESLSDAARRSLASLGVEVRLSTAVTGCDPAGVALGADRLEARTIVWGAGVMASPAGDWLGATTDRAGRVIVRGDFSIPGEPRIFVIGDAACAKDCAGKPLPGIAPVAKQQGHYIGQLIDARIAGRPKPSFRYRDFGNLATIGRKRAVAEFLWLRLSGFPAWLLWSMAHVYFLIGFRNRAFVAASWVWTYLTSQRGTRLITGLSSSRATVAAPGTPGKSAARAA
jgi:NADH:ubiquinone reductase (H+-translocating)